MNEAETRVEHIDPALKAAGWGAVEGSRIRWEYPITPGRLEGHGRRGKPLTADYVLEYRNTKLVVVEAKGELKPGATSFKTGSLGSFEIKAGNILLGKPFIFNQANIDRFDF